MTSEPPGSEVYIGLGANLLDPMRQLDSALEAMSGCTGLRLLKTSSFYGSAPMGPSDQPDYINAVCCLECTLAPLVLLDSLQAIEQDLGRHRDPARGARHWGPRSLDLDILLFGDEVIDLPRLSVPHPGIVKRSFVLLPLLEIAADITVPGVGSASDYVQTVEMFGIRKLEPKS